MRLLAAPALFAIIVLGADCAHVDSSNTIVPPTSGTEPAETPKSLDGQWQSYDYNSERESYAMQFDGTTFRAQLGSEEWYEGTITLSPGDNPARIDFFIEDCKCGYKGQTSTGIYFWDGDTIVMSSPAPGEERPKEFLDSDHLMRLKRL